MEGQRGMRPALEKEVEFHPKSDSNLIWTKLQGPGPQLKGDAAPYAYMDEIMKWKLYISSKSSPLIMVASMF